MADRTGDLLVVRYDDDEGPLVRVHLTAGDKTVVVRALLDTGSYRTLLPVAVANDLGLPLRKTRDRAQGAGRRRLKTYACSDAVLADVYSVAGGTPSIWGPQFELEPHFAKRVDPPLLGRDDFLRCFVVTFDWGSNTVLIRAPAGATPPARDHA